MLPPLSHPSHKAKVNVKELVRTLPCRLHCPLPWLPEADLTLRKWL